MTISNAISFAVSKHHHTKRNFDYFLCVASDRMSEEQFAELRTACVASGGWYSRKFGKTPGGFAFKEHDDATSFADEFGATVKVTSQSHSVAISRNWRIKQANKLNDLIANIDKDIRRLDEPRLENTPKRQKEGAVRRSNSDCLKRLREAILCMVDVFTDSGDIDPLLLEFTSKKRILAAMATRSDQTNGYYSHRDTGEFIDTSDEAKALQALLDPKRLESEIQASAKMNSRNEIIRKASLISGFFPTPEVFANELVDIADIEDGHNVLEPSAGIGSIAELIRERFPVGSSDVLLHCYEVVPMLAEYMREQLGMPCKDSDFLADDSVPDGFYDRIVMNPPFENGQAIDHIRHALTKLKPGGKLVSVGPSSLEFRTDGKHTDFREFVSSHGGTIEPVDGKMFENGDRSTLVNCCIVVIEKPVEVEPIDEPSTALTVVNHPVSEVDDDTSETVSDDSDSATEKQHELDLHVRLRLDTRLKGCLDSESTRYALSHAQVTPSESDNTVFVAATNGRLAAVIAAEGTADRQYLMPSEVLPTTQTGAVVELNGQWQNSKGRYQQETDAPGRFPKVEEVLPAIDPDSRVLHINADFILEIAKALNAKSDDGQGITLFVPPAPERDNADGKTVEGAIAIVGHRGIGVVMPCCGDVKEFAQQQISKYNTFASEYRTAIAYTRENELDAI